MKSLEAQREDNRMECVKNCPANEGSFCEKHFQIDCEFSRRIGERDNRSDDCPNCADQASIAAPGETVLCKTHGDEKHFREMKEFFIEECERLIFKPHTPFCSVCGTEKHVVYVGAIITNDGQPLIWSFCFDCRHKLVLKQNAARAALERI